jgi:hypothetical protein
MEFALDKLLNEIEEINKNSKIIGNWQNSVKKYKCGEFQIIEDLIGQENILKENFDQNDLDNFRKVFIIILIIKISYFDITSPIDLKTITNFYFQ